MSEPVILGVPITETGRSAVEVKTTAKGDVQVIVKVYSGDLEEVDAVRAKAVETFNALREEVGA